MLKTKKFTVTISSEDFLDVTIEYEKKAIRKFALNYRAIVKGKMREIYRVDNFHGFLHEQRFGGAQSRYVLTMTEVYHCS